MDSSWFLSLASALPQQPLKILDSLALGVNPCPPRGQYSLRGGSKAGAHACSSPRTQGFSPGHRPVAGSQHIRVLEESHPPCWEPKVPPLSLSTSMPAFPSQSLPRLHPYSLGLSWAAWEAPGSLATVWYSLCKTDSPTSLQGQLYTTSPESLRTDLQLRLCQSHSMGPKPPLTPSQLRCLSLATCPSRHSLTFTFPCELQARVCPGMLMWAEDLIQSLLRTELLSLLWSSPSTDYTPPPPRTPTHHQGETLHLILWEK